MKNLNAKPFLILTIILILGISSVQGAEEESADAKKLNVCSILIRLYTKKYEVNDKNALNNMIFSCYLKLTESDMNEITTKLRDKKLANDLDKYKNILDYTDLGSKFSEKKLGEEKLKMEAAINNYMEQSKRPGKPNSRNKNKNNRGKGEKTVQNIGILSRCLIFLANILASKDIVSLFMFLLSLYLILRFMCRLKRLSDTREIIKNH